MNRGDAYKLLATRLNDLRAAGYAEPLQRVGQPATSHTIHLGGEPIAIEVQVTWVDHKRNALRVSATAYGPSTWTTERLEESMVIAPKDAEE